MSFAVTNQATTTPRPPSSASGPAPTQPQTQKSYDLAGALAQILSSLGGSASSSASSSQPQSGSTSSLSGGGGSNKTQKAAATGSLIGGVIGSIFPGIGTAVGSFVGGILGSLTTMFGGKHKDQVARDQMRTGLQQLGLIDQNYQIQLANGSGYDVGKDGGFKLTNMDGTQRRAYETDMSNPITGQVIGWVNPLATLIAGGNEKIRTDLAGYLTNAAMSNATTLEEAQANVLAFYTKLGVTPENAGQVLQQIASSGSVPQDVLPAFAHGLQTLFTPPTASANTEPSTQAA